MAAAAAQWQELATTAIYQLFQATVQPLGPFASTVSALSLRRAQLAILAGGGDEPMNIDLVGPAALLGQASHNIARFNEVHHRVIRVMSICGRVLGVITDDALWGRNLAVPPQAAAQPQQATDPLWQLWLQRRDQALFRASQVSVRLRAVAAYDLATVDAFTVALSFPGNSTSRNAWMRAARNLAATAELEARVLSQAEVLMCSAVTAEFNVALVIWAP